LEYKKKARAHKPQQQETVGESEVKKARFGLESTQKNNEFLWT